MAKLLEEMIVIKVSKLIPDNNSEFVPPVVNDSVINELTDLFTELAGKNSLVEIVTDRA